MDNTETLKVFTVEWTASNDELTKITAGTTEVVGYTEASIDKTFVLYELTLERNFGLKLHKQHISTRIATEAEIAEHKASVERDRINSLMSN